jgi:signal transduction histidine kinase
VTWSLRRSLAVRFAATMAAGLLVATAAFYWAASRALEQALASPAALEGDLLLALVAVVVCGTAATLMGAWHFTSSAVRPVAEITAQATRIEAGTLDQRIVAHADTEEYEGLVAVLNRMLERLETGFAAQRRLTADMSHELRTPLTALRGEIEVALRSDRSPRDYQIVLRSALEEIDQLTTLSEDLLLITRADAHVLPLHRESTDVTVLVERALERLRTRAAQRDLTVRRAVHAGAERASLDPELAARLVDHLLENAVNHAPVGGTVAVTVEAAAPGGGVRLVVENSGDAIDPADLPHLFEPFYRCDPARTRDRRGAGPGLGLAIVAAIARLHNGVARVSSVAGRGTRFEVDLQPSSN